MYFEQKLSLSYEQMYAIAIIKSSVIGGLVTKMMKTLGSTENPTIPEEVELWQMSQHIASIKLNEDISRAGTRKLD